MSALSVERLVSAWEGDPAIVAKLFAKRQCCAVFTLSVGWEDERAMVPIVRDM